MAGHAARDHVEVGFEEKHAFELLESGAGLGLREEVEEQGGARLALLVVDLEGLEIEEVCLQDTCLFVNSRDEAKNCALPCLWKRHSLNQIAKRCL